jgi:hypothetical protein
MLRLHSTLSHDEPGAGMIDVQFLLKLAVGTGFFAFVVYCAQRPYALVQRAAGMMLTFPLLNGITLVMTDTSQTALKVSTMMPLIAFNGLLCLGFFLNTERLARLRRPPSPLLLTVAATAVWLCVKSANFALPPEWQARYIAAYGVLAFWLLLGVLPERTTSPVPGQPFWHRNNMMRCGLFAAILAVILLIGQWPDWSALTGQISAFPLPGVFALYVVSADPAKTPDVRIQTLRQLRSTVLLGPVVSMIFVYLLWPHVGQNDWPRELLLLVVPAWIAALAVIFALSAAFGLIESLQDPKP